MAVAEVEHQELWQRSQVSVVTVGTEDQYVQQLLNLAAEEAQRVVPDCTVEASIEIV